MVDPHHPRLSIARQCRLLSVARSSYYRQPASERPETLALMRAVDAQFLETPWYGSRQMARHRQRQGWRVGRHRIRRLMVDRPPLGGPRRMFVEGWPLRQRERGR